jgi:flagellar hook-length control protein FliK
MTLEQVNSLPSNDLSSAVSTKKSNNNKDAGFSGILSFAAGKKINVVNSVKALNSVAKISKEKVSADNTISISKKADTDNKTGDIKDSLKNNQNSLKIDSKDDNKVFELDSEQKSNIIGKIEEDLSVTEDQIVNAMQILGLSFQDLFDPKNLMQLMSQLLGKGDDSSALLMNQGVKDLINDFKALSAEIGIDYTNPTKDSDQKNVVINTEPISEPADENTGIKEDFSLNNEIKNPETVDNPAIVTDDKEQAGDASKVNITVSDQKEKTEETEEVNTFTQDETQGLEENVKIDPETMKSEDQSFKENFFSKNNSGKNSTEIPIAKENTTAVFTHTYSMTEAIYETTSASNHEVKLADSIIDQIVRSAKLTLTDTSSTMEMVLDPERLGKIYMEVTARDGAIKAKIMAENENVKNMLETRLDILQQNFKEQGIKVDSVEISVGSRNLSENDSLENTFDSSQDHKGREGENKEDNKKSLHRIDLNNLDGLKGLMTEEELLTAKIMKEEGNTLSYQA